MKNEILTSTVKAVHDPVTLRSFAAITGLSIPLLHKYCKQGRIFGARQHARTKQWLIYPPAKILPSLKRW
jgi:hypothetical protein